MKYTPGPWYANMEPGVNAPVYIKGEKGTFPIVDFVYGKEGDSDNNYENAKANAQLIAAAPELLEALKSLTDKCDKGGWLQEEIDQARKAIAKAEDRE